MKIKQGTLHPGFLQQQQQQQLQQLQQQQINQPIMLSIPMGIKISIGQRLIVSFIILSFNSLFSSSLLVVSVAFESLSTYFLIK